MKRWLTAVALMVVVGAGLYLLFCSTDKPVRPTSGDSSSPPSSVRNQAAPTVPSTEPENRPPDSGAGAPAETSPVHVLPGAAATAPVPAPVFRAPEFTNLPPVTVLENMRAAIRAYGSTFNGNPVGTNPEITRALNGENPKQLKFIRAEDGVRINEQGELVDPWGTPFFFHQLSANETEIHCAGPDRILWTADDLVIR